VGRLRRLSVTSTSPCPQPPGRLSVWLAARESRGDTKAGAPKRARVKEQKMFGLTPVTGRLIIQDTPTCRPEVVKEVAAGFVRLLEEATEVLRRLKERLGFCGALVEALPLGSKDRDLDAIARAIFDDYYRPKTAHAGDRSPDQRADRGSHHLWSGSGGGRQGRGLLTAGRACLSVYIV
jgi:hypothetical protein